MSLRDLFVILVVLGALPYCLGRPFFGLLVFSWLAYMRPQDLCWGPARTMRFSLYVAVCMFGGWLVVERRPFLRTFSNTIWMYGIVLLVTASLFFNEIYWPERQISRWIDLLKVFAVAFFTTGMVDSRRRLTVLLWTIALSLGFYGIKGGLFGLAGGRIQQGPGGMMKDNNDLCLAMCMNVPFLYYLGMSARDKLVRNACLFAVFLTAVTVVVTTSRGGFLTLAAVMMLLIAKSRHRIVGFTLGGIVALVFFLSLPADVWKRLETLRDPTREGSAAGRLHAWGVAWRMIKDNPLLGVGFENFLANFRRYDPAQQREAAKEGVGSVRVAHNTYLQIWAESGTPAFLCFMLGILFSVLLMRRLRRIAGARAPPWIAPYTHMVEVSFAAFIVGGTFLNRAHFDLLYHLIAIAGVIWSVGIRELVAPGEDADVGEAGDWTSAPPRPNAFERPALASAYPRRS